MSSKLNHYTVLLTATFAVACIEAQTTKPASGNTVAFRDVMRSKVASVPEPPADLQQITAELSGTLVGRQPNVSIQFILFLQNNGPQEVKIRDPLDWLSLNFSTIGKGPIDVPERIRGDLVGVPRNASPGAKRDELYLAPIQFRRIVRGTMASYEKEEVITIPSGGKVQIEFESEPIVMEKVMAALRTETGENAKSFQAKGFLPLISDPPAGGGRPLHSDPISFTIPAP